MTTFLILLAVAVVLFFLYKKFIANSGSSSSTSVPTIPVTGATRTVQFYGRGDLDVTYVDAGGNTQTATVQGTGGTLCVKGGVNGVLNDGGATTVQDIGSC